MMFYKNIRTPPASHSGRSPGELLYKYYVCELLTGVCDVITRPNSCFQRERGRRRGQMSPSR